MDGLHFLYEGQEKRRAGPHGGTLGEGRKRENCVSCDSHSSCAYRVTDAGRPHSCHHSCLCFFAHRWDFVQKNNVQLPDEYDAIMHDIEPFFSLPPSILKARAHQLAKDPNFHHSQQSFTIDVRDGRPDLTGPLRFSARAGETKALIEGFAEYLPDMQ